MSNSEIKKGMKVHDILADYFTKDLKVKASLEAEDIAEDNQSEGKRHRHHKKHKKNKRKRKKSHNDDDSEPDEEELFLLEQDVKRRKLEYELLKEQEKERRKSRKKSQDEVSMDDAKEKHADHKHHCKKHKQENISEKIATKHKSVDDNSSGKGQTKRKLPSSIVLAKEQPHSMIETNVSCHDQVELKDSRSETKSKEKDISPSLSSKGLKDKSQHTDESHSKNTETSLKETFHESPERKLCPSEPKETPLIEKVTTDDVIASPQSKETDMENTITAEDKQEQKEVANDTKLDSGSIPEMTDENVTQEKTNSLPELSSNKNLDDDSKDEVFEKKDTSSKSKPKISIKSLKNLDLPMSKEDSDAKVDSLNLEEGEVVDSDDDDNEDGEEEGSDFFKGDDDASKEERKKKKKHKHKKSKKKKKSKDSKSPESKSSSRRLSESSSHHHYHHHSHNYPDPDDRYFEEHRHHGYRRTSRDRSHSPGTRKRFNSRGSPRGRMSRECSISLDLREKIDKKRLLEIARKNVLSMIEKGTLPSGISANALAQQQLVTLRAGGKSVAELTEFCKGLVNGKDFMSSDSSDDEGRRRAVSEDEGDTPFINHPFKLKEPLPHIRMNIPNAVQIPVRTADTAKLRQIFPVSSGNQHRIKELEWVPVEKTETTTSTTTTVSKKTSKEPKAIMPPPTPTPTPPIVSAPIPLPPPPAALLFPPPTPQLAIGPAPPLTMGASGSLVPMAGPLVDLDEPPPPGVSTTPILMPPPPPPPPPPEPEPQPEQQPSMGVDISSIVAKRLNAVRRLQENPLDVQALNQMFQAQQQMKDWAHSKLQPGQFGAAPNTRLLTPSELSGPSPVWAKKNQLTSAAPVSDGVGMNLLRKMGWNPGEGLGKNKEGALTPLMLDIKMDKKGLVSTTEGNKPPPKVNVTNKIRQDLSGKHPVSALMELCSKRKWGPPEYTLLDEGGPAHRKNFLFKVRVQGMDYQPSVSSPNKKQAKALAAQVCLQGLGLLPRT